MRSLLRFGLPLAVLTALILLFFWQLAGTSLILARGDMFLYFYPYWHYRAVALQHWRLPLWTPEIFMGAPFLANPQTGTLYPFNWLLAPFTAPVAIKIAILAHLSWAALGVYAVARRLHQQSILAALLAGACFSLGGYVTSQVEHVNQLQALAWWPWFLLNTHYALKAWGERQPIALKPMLLAAACLALALLAGHTQTVFIMLVGTGLYHLLAGPNVWQRGRDAEKIGHLPKVSARLWDSAVSKRVLPLALVFGLVGVGAGLLAAAQLLPTLELSRESLRSGGLPVREVLSFTLPWRLLGRALLPGYSRTLFSEFVAYPGLVALSLAVLGARQPRPRRWALVALVVLGMGLALGGYALFASLPPFNLFRVPARWLALAVFALALLAGEGLDSLRAAQSRSIDRRGLSHWFQLGNLRETAAVLLNPKGLCVLTGLGLMALTPLAVAYTAPGETGPLGWPLWVDWLGWGSALIVTGLLLNLPLPNMVQRLSLAGCVLLELFLASQVLSYNHLTAPEAWSSVRPAMTQFLALPAQTATTVTSTTILNSSNMVTTVSSPATPSQLSTALFLQANVPGRFLSLSALRFDPGDLAELHSVWDRQLSVESVYDLIVATKHKEVLSPNLPLAWGVAAVDGYDGGVLPLRRYAAFAELLAKVQTSDGRLRENLTSLPEGRWLGLANVRYVVTDKVGDAWVEGVYYDQQIPLTLTAGQMANVTYVPPFQATALRLIGDELAGSVTITFADGTIFQSPLQENVVVSNLQSSIFNSQLAPLPTSPQKGGGDSGFQSPVSSLQFPQPVTPLSITFSGPMALRSATLVDERTGAFQALTLGPYRLVHSGDVKIYEYAQRLPRAFVLAQTQAVPDMATALAQMQATTFDPAQAVLLETPVLAEFQAEAVQPVSFELYTPERIQLKATGPGYLVLTDAHYPGWVAKVDGEPTPIYAANVAFRAIALPPGVHTVTFDFAPWTVVVGLGVSVLAWGAAVGTWLWEEKKKWN